MRIVEFRKGIPVVPSERKSWFDEEKVILRTSPQLYAAGDDGVLKEWFTRYSMEQPMETLERAFNAPPVLSYQPYQKEAVVQKIEYYMRNH